MVSTSKANLVGLDVGVNQGDVFRNVKYSYIDSEDDTCVEICELIFPYAMVVSQSCDVAFMDSFDSGIDIKAVKYMPAILMCPIYPKESIRHAGHLKEILNECGITLTGGEPYYNRDDIKVAENDQHVRFHALKVELQDPKKILIDGAVVDFKHIFSVPMRYLRNNRDNRICRIEDIYIDQIVNKMSAFISRIGLPDDKKAQNDCQLIEQK